MAQIFHIERAFPARDQQPDREPLLNPQLLAILAIGDEHVVQGLSHRQGVAEFALVRPFRNQPGPAFFHARLVQQHRQRHAGPFAGAGHAVDELDR